MAFLLLDTSTISLLMRKHAKAVERLEALPPGSRVMTSVIVRGEINYGVEALPAGRRRELLSRVADALFASLPVEALPVAAAERYATLKTNLRRSGVAEVVPRRDVRTTLDSTGIPDPREASRIINKAAPSRKNILLFVLRRPQMLFHPAVTKRQLGWRGMMPSTNFTLERLLEARSKT